MVADADAFFGILDRYHGVKGVLWGHVHQEIDRLRNGVRLLASPLPVCNLQPVVKISKQMTNRRVIAGWNCTATGASKPPCPGSGIPNLKWN